MRSGYDNNNSSAVKRIIPAAAMLALSAVMLSTSTYAWFTMNKEVKMTGLAMSATTGESMEIALASVSDSGAISAPAAGSHPGDDDKGWKSAVVVGDYYAKIGKLRPASSVDGKNLYDATDASDGGQKADNFVQITLDTSDTPEAQKKMAALELKREIPNESNAAAISSDGRVGYYVDIPVYLRTNKMASDADTTGTIYCKLKIKDNTTGGSSANKDLYKSVRVAFVPIDTGSGSTVKIFGVNSDYYNAGQAVNGTSSKGAVTVTMEYVTDGEAFTAGDGVDSGLKIPYATAENKYGHLDFMVRVWIEGESEFCKDATAGQSWNIDLAFSLDKFSDGSGTSTT